MGGGGLARYCGGTGEGDPPWLEISHTADRSLAWGLYCHYTGGQRNLQDHTSFTQSLGIHSGVLNWSLPPSPQPGSRSSSGPDLAPQW